MRAVLMLHGVDDSGSVISVTAEQLRSLVRSIRDSGHDVVRLEDLLAGRHARGIALTFDDGFESVAEAAAGVLVEVGAPATLFLTTGWVGRSNQWPGQSEAAPAFSMIRWDQVKRISEQGFTIECHSVNHADLRRLPDESLEREIADSKAAIAEAVGRTPTVFAYPYGWYDRRVRDFVARHFKWSVTTRMATLDDADDPLQVPRLDAYYLRAAAVHRHFGGRRFTAYLGLRGLMRRLRGHPGEIGVES